MLIGSFFVLKTDDDKEAKGCVINDMEKPENMKKIITIIRIMHSCLIASQLFKHVAAGYENDLIVKFFKVIEMFFYVGTILY